MRKTSCFRMDGYTFARALPSTSTAQNPLAPILCDSPGYVQR